ncbi:MAG TPA: transcription antitermination factor NusB [Thermoleophilia bacterium]|nr:transcription antitermination factor NusB [Thermoleophilia bacterium]
MAEAGRRRARRDAVVVLYQQDLLGLSADAALERALAGGSQISAYTRRLVHGVEEHRQELDGWVDANLRGWSVERLGAVERNILRVGAFELRHVEEVGDAVAINEAVELAKRFGSFEAAGLVNGVLGAMAKGE